MYVQNCRVGTGRANRRNGLLEVLFSRNEYFVKGWRSGPRNLHHNYYTGF